MVGDLDLGITHVRATPAQKLEKMSRMARELNELTRAEIRGR